MHYSKKSLVCLAATAMRSSSTRTVSAFMPASFSRSPSSPRAAFQIQTATRTGRSSFTSSAAAFYATNGSSFASSSSASFTMNLNRTARDSKSTLSFTPTTLPSPVETILIAKKETLSNSNANTKLPIPPTAPMEAMLKSIGKSGKATTFLPDGSKFTIIILPDEVTRNNHPMSPHSITDSLNAAGLASTLKKTFETDADADDSTIEGADAIVSSGVQIIVVDKDIRDSIGAVAVAIARAMPVYTAKSLSKKEEEASDVSEGHVVNVSYLTTQDGELTFIDDEYLNSSAKAVADGVRLAGKLGDMPPAELTPETYSMQCRYIVEDLQKNGHSVVMEEIVGEELRERGYGGIYGVGMAAMVTPRIVIMTYTPEGSGDDVESIALCGKGVVYDTGGLSLKPKSGMPGMKHDMGGSAGVLCGFKAAVELKVQKKVTLILGIVENAIGPKAVRNDDILTMYSGKTVEINNTDAEGRLVLGDCVAHASKHIQGLDIILDMATLTGAQLVCTGKKHAGILARTEKMEKRIFQSGMKSGDLCYPMLYAPELLKSEFASKVADMKNSVKDRGNAQASCAGHFIESHLDSAYKGEWVHVDMAGPSEKNDRATGYGVALVLGLLQAPAFC